VALFAGGFAHVHFHMVPRDPGLPGEFRGPRVFSLLGADPARLVGTDAMDRISAELANALDLMPGPA
jgi:diadenosine tetraphosphate (Ap4A) HIT family hydrolase